MSGVAAGGRFDGQRALVTGGAGGLGLAAAERLATEGAAVALLDRDRDGVEAAAARLRDAGHAARAFVADVADEAAVAAAVDDLIAVGGRIDVLVTMAGAYPWTPFAELTLDAWRETVAVNLDGTYVCAHAVLPAMRRARYGRIVTVSSEAALLGVPEFAAYGAAKAGVLGLTRALAREGGPHGITANAVLPGLIETERALASARDAEALFAAVVARQCVPRRGLPADVADAVAYLASPSTSFVTGEALRVGGGATFG